MIIFSPKNQQSLALRPRICQNLALITIDIKNEDFHMFQRVAQSTLFCFCLLGASLSFGFAVRDDIHGTLQNNIYTNSVLGLSIRFPEEWKTSLNTTGLKTQIIANSSPKSLSDTVTPNGFLLFSVSAKPGEEIIGNAYELSSTDVKTINSIAQILEQIKFALLHATKLTNDNMDAIEISKLGGVEFASMKIHYIDTNNKPVTETLYAGVRDKYVLFFTTIYNTPEQATELQNAFNTMLFY